MNWQLFVRLSHSPDRQKVFIIIKWIIPFKSKVTLNSSLIKNKQRKNKRNIVTTSNQSLNAVMIQAKHVQDRIQFLPSPIFLSDKDQILSQTQFNFCKLLKFNSNIFFLVQANCSYSFAGWVCHAGAENSKVLRLSNLACTFLNAFLRNQIEKIMLSISNWFLIRKPAWVYWYMLLN